MRWQAELRTHLSVAILECRYVFQSAILGLSASSRQGITASRGLSILNSNEEQPTLPHEVMLPSTISLSPTLIVGSLTVTSTSSPKPVIEGYEILGELGRGGMGVVYKARQNALNRTVALKMVLSGATAGSQELTRFLSEAQAIARLQHPHIVQIYDVSEHNGLPFFSMEFVDGGSLSQKLAGTPQPAKFAAEMVLRLARAIQAAHDRGIIHRDLKPGNILLTADGLPKIADFGLAKQLGLESGQTQTGEILGTPSYMAPEQALGNVSQITSATDVYALGAILYELLCGRPPLRGKNAIETVRMVITQEPPAPSSIASQTPRDLETVCLKCLQKEPAKRYPTADALADDLQRFLNGEPILARPVSTVERFWRWCHRNPTVAGLTVAVFLALTAGTVVATHFAWVASERAVAEADARQRAERKEKEATNAAHAEGVAKDLAKKREGEAVQAAALAKVKEGEAKESAEQEKVARKFAEEKQAEANAAREEVSRKATQLEDQVYRSTVSLAHHELQAANAVRSSDLLGATDAKRRGWEWKYCWRAAHIEQMILQLDGKDEFRGLEYSPDGTRIAVGGHAGTVAVWDAAMGRLLMQTKVPKTNAYINYMRHNLVHWTPDGAGLIVAGLDNSIKILDSSTGKILQSFEGFRGGVGSAAISPDGRLVAGTSGLDGNIETYEALVFDTRTGKQVYRLLGHLQPLNGVVFSPDGTLLATAGGDHMIKLWNVQTGDELRTLTGHKLPVIGVAFSPDSRRLGSTGQDGLAMVWDVASGERLFTMSGHDGDAVGIAFSPNGQKIATTGNDQLIKLWDTNGRHLLSLSGHVWSVFGVTFSPDGTKVVSACPDRTLRFWDANSDRQYHKLGEQRLGVRVVAIGSSSRRMVTLGAQTGIFPNEYSVWDLTTRERVRNDHSLFPAHFLPMTSIDISPDERLLIGAAGHVAKGLVRLWEVDTGRELWRLSDEDIKSKVICTAFDPQGGRIACSLVDGRLQFRDVSDGKLISESQNHVKAIPHMRFSKRGEWLATVGMDQTTIWDRSGSIKWVLPSVGRAYRDGRKPMAFRQDGRLLAISAMKDQWGTVQDHVISIVDLETGKTQTTLTGHIRAINSLDFAADGRLASGSEDNTIKIWDVAAGAELLTLRGHTAAVTTVDFTPDGSLLISGGEDGTVLTWDSRPPYASPWLDVEQGPPELKSIVAELCQVNPLWPGAVKHVHVASGQITHLDLSGHVGLNDVTPLTKLTSLKVLNLDNTRVASISSLAALPLHELRLKNTPVANLESLHGLPLEVIDIRGTRVVTVESLPETLTHLWTSIELVSDRSSTGRLVKLQQINEVPVTQFYDETQHEIVLAGHTGDVHSVSLSMDQSAVASTGIDGTVRLWDVSSRRGRILNDSTDRQVGPVAWSFDGKFLVWCETFPDGTSQAVVWDQSLGKPIRSQKLAGVVRSLAQHPRQRQFACGLEGGRIQLFSHDSAQEVATLSGPDLDVLSLAFSRDGELLAGGFGNHRDWFQPGSVLLWDVKQRRKVGTADAPGAVRTLSFDPQQSRLAGGGSNWRIHVLDFSNPANMAATIVARFQLVQGRPKAIEFLTEDRIAIAGDTDELVLGHLSMMGPNAPAGPVPPPRLLRGHTAPLCCLSASIDTQTLVTGSSDGTVRVWRTPK